MQVRRALISVSDKRDLKNFVKTLSKLGIEIISTGGTAKLLQDAGFKVEEVSTLTGFNEILDGRVKTLHPKIHGGLLALRDSKKHMSELKNYGIPPIDMVVVNLYPFEDAVKDENVTLEDAQENIDIGGSTLIRAAAKNFTNVAVVVDPNSYDGIAVELVKNNCALSRQTLHSLAVSAFDYSSEYDSIIFNFLSGGEG